MKDTTKKTLRRVVDIIITILTALAATLSAQAAMAV